MSQVSGVSRLNASKIKTVSDLVTRTPERIDKFKSKLIPVDFVYTGVKPNVGKSKKRRRAPSRAHSESKEAQKDERQTRSQKKSNADAISTALSRPPWR